MHFTVLVTGDDVEGALAPFQENNMEDCPKEYLVFCNVEDGAESKGEMKAYRTGSGQVYQNLESGAISLIYSYNPKVALRNWKVAYKHLFPDIQAYLLWCGYRKDPTTGKYGYWYNPNSRWDWWTTGGRWRGMFVLKPGVTSGVVGEEPRLVNLLRPDLIPAPPELPSNVVDSALKGDIDWIASKQRARQELIQEWLKEQDVLPRYRITQPGLKAHLIANMPWACMTKAILHNGKWIDRPDYWGPLTRKKLLKWRKKYWRIINRFPDDLRLTVVDCHI